VLSTVLWVLGQIVVGLLYANITEWIMHKHILHGFGKRKNSWFSFHWWGHHKPARQNGNADDDYKRPLWRAGVNRWKEVFSLKILVWTHMWLAIFAPVFWLTLVFSAFLYYFVHKKSHVDVVWGKKWLRHHYDHHMGVNQDKNWCVTHPLADYLLRTREKNEYDEKGRPKKNKTRSAA
jgi:hypothetical protein